MLPGLQVSAEFCLPVFALVVMLASALVVMLVFGRVSIPGVVMLALVKVLVGVFSLSVLQL